jgi:competence protein ComEA
MVNIHILTPLNNTTVKISIIHLRRNYMLRKASARRFWFSSLLFLTGFIGLSFVFGIIPSYAAEASKTLIDLNTASTKDLESIKGVGPATSKKIIEGRPYKSVDDLKKAGISDKLLESIKPFVKVGEAPVPGKIVAETKTVTQAKTVTPAKTAVTVPDKITTPTEKVKTSSKTTTETSTKLAPGQKVNLNTATKEQIEALPGIGPVKAQAIIAGRPYKVPEDIMKVKGIKEGTFNKIKGSITVQ